MMTLTKPTSCSIRIAPEGAFDAHVELCRILAERDVAPLFQPILNLGSGEIIGFEGLIRGPSDSPLHSPVKLLGAARHAGMATEIEQLCRQAVMAGFVQLNLPGRLFLNVSPDILVAQNACSTGVLEDMDAAGIDPSRVVIELTENEPSCGYGLETLLVLARHYHSRGLDIAIDDLGEGFSSLRLWEELRPALVKIDRHFIQNIDKDRVKAQFARSIQEIARHVGADVIAEGIETSGELQRVRELGIAMVQGYLIGRPASEPSGVVPVEARLVMGRPAAAVAEATHSCVMKPACARDLADRDVPCVLPEDGGDEVLEYFLQHALLDAIPVVRADGVPVGLVGRVALLAQLGASPRFPGKVADPVAWSMDIQPLVVEGDTPLIEVANLLVSGNARHFSQGYVVTEQGRYLGVGNARCLMRELAHEFRSRTSFRDALASIPADRPLREAIDAHLVSGDTFWVCFADLTHFKAFNRVYGYARGDGVIAAAASVLSGICDVTQDRMGYLGKDHFWLILRAPHQEQRIRRALEQFDQRVVSFFSQADLERGGYISESRRGDKEFHPVITLSVGAVPVSPGEFHHADDVLDAAADA